MFPEIVGFCRYYHFSTSFLRPIETLSHAYPKCHCYLAVKRFRNHTGLFKSYAPLAITLVLIMISICGLWRPSSYRGGNFLRYFSVLHPPRGRGGGGQLKNFKWQPPSCDTSLERAWKKKIFGANRKSIWPPCQKLGGSKGYLGGPYLHFLE